MENTVVQNPEGRFGEDAPVPPKAMVWLAVVLLASVSLPALWFHGYIGIITPLLQTWAGGQVFTDLVIALVLVLAWMWSDAKKYGRAFLPWLLLTLAAGSFGPLCYLLFRPNPEKKNF